MQKVSLATLVLGLVSGCGNSSDNLDRDVSSLGGVLTDVTDVALNRDVVCAVSFGHVFCGSVETGLRQVSDLEFVVDVGVGDSRTCVVAASGTYCWSADLVPTKLPATGPYVVVGDSYSCVMTNDGPTSCAGSIVENLGASYMLYGAPNRVCVVTPARRLTCATPNASSQLLDQPRDVLALAIGDTHACASNLTTRRVACWGDNRAGQLGLDLNVQADELAAGDAFTCALTQVRGEVLCWGDSYGPSPVRITLPRLPMSIGARHSRACAVLEDNTLACWRKGETPALVHSAE